MTEHLFGVIFAAAIFAFALVVYLLFLQFRRAKYRKLADSLGATYQYQGFAATGEIQGVDDGRAYTVKTKAAGRSGMWTVASAECANRGVSLTIYGRFFKRFPDWRFVFIDGAANGASPGVKVALLGTGRPIGEKDEIPIQTLFQEISLSRGEVFKKGKLKVDQNSISFTRHGVVTNLEAARQIIDGITEIARRVEAAPLV